MLKSFSHLIACLLLVLVPVQSFAAASMLICNSMMQSQQFESKKLELKEAVKATAEANMQQMSSMPCHQHMANVSHEQKNDTHNSPCKTHCVSICASLCAMSALPSYFTVANLASVSQNLMFPQALYTSITPTNLQRPPITLS